MIQQLNDSINFTDSLNFRRINSFLTSYGFYGGVLSPVNPSILHTVLLHASERWLIKNQQLLPQEVKKGHLLPRGYAATLDRKLFFDHNLGEYYGQYLNSPKVKSFRRYKKRCRKIGLSPYYKIDNELLPKGKKAVRIELNKG